MTGVRRAPARSDSHRAGTAFPDYGEIMRITPILLVLLASCVPFDTNMTEPQTDIPTAEVAEVQAASSLHPDPNCKYRAFCIRFAKDGQPKPGGRAGVIEIVVGTGDLAPAAITETMEWRVYQFRGYGSGGDPYLWIRDMRIRGKSCGNGYRSDCKIQMLPGQKSTLHDRQGKVRSKRALKVWVSDSWRLSRTGECYTSWVDVIAQNKAGYRLRNMLPVRACR